VTESRSQPMRGEARVDDLAKRNVPGINVMAMTLTTSFTRFRRCAETPFQVVNEVRP